MGSDRTLIIAAHPDDEVLGAGGWMVRYPDSVSIAIVSEGTSANGDADTAAYYERLRLKRDTTQRLAKSLGHEVVWMGDYPVLRIHQCDALKLTQDLEWVMRQVRPATVLTHAPFDLNRDHRTVAEATMVVTRGYVDSGESVRRVLGFAVDALAAPAVTPATLGMFYLTLTDMELEAKLALCEAYTTEMRPWPHPRSREALAALARWSGARIGRPAAEPYTLLWGCQ